MSRVVLVTGASSGIGEAIARALLNEGDTVYAAARRMDAMTELQAAGARLLELDVTDDAAIAAAVRRILDDQGRIDVLITNAGYGSYGAVEDVTMDEARRQFDVNVFGLAALTREVLPSMRERRAGTVINISSIGGRLHTPFGAWYHATKFAVEGFSDALRWETEPFGIDVVVIEPGAIKTKFEDVASRQLMETSGQGPYKVMVDQVAVLMREFMKDGSPPEVIAALVLRALRAAKPKTRYVAGQGAKPFLFLRRVISDRMFDRLLWWMVRRYAGRGTA